MDEIQAKIKALEDSKETYIAEIDREILSLRKELKSLQEQKYREAAFDYSQTRDLKKLSIPQLQYIICDRVGLEATYPLRTWRQSIFSRMQCQGDITWFELSDEQYKKLLCLYITNELSCKRCKKYSHWTKDCSK